MFQHNLRNAREGRDLSQKEMAKRLSIPVTTYRNYENTLREPSYDVLAKICEVLNTSADELLGVSINNAKYINLFSKIKSLDSEKLTTLKTFVDFLISVK